MLKLRDEWHFQQINISCVFSSPPSIPCLNQTCRIAAASEPIALACLSNLQFIYHHALGLLLLKHKSDHVTFLLRTVAASPFLSAGSLC